MSELVSLAVEGRKPIRWTWHYAVNSHGYNLYWKEPTEIRMLVHQELQKRGRCYSWPRGCKWGEKPICLRFKINTPAVKQQMCCKCNASQRAMRVLMLAVLEATPNLCSRQHRAVLQQQGTKPIQFQADTQEFAEREAQAISKQPAF